MPEARPREAYRDLFAAILAILFEEDATGINFETNAEEYKPEVGTILPRLRHCGEVCEVWSAVHEEFVLWFAADSAGPAERYLRVAERIWKERQRRSASEPLSPR